MKADIKIVIAKNIADLRLANGMTQLELAERINYSDKAVSKWERAESMPDIAVLTEIADLFQVSLDDLVRLKKPIEKASVSPEASEPKKKTQPCVYHRHGDPISVVYRCIGFCRYGYASGGKYRFIGFPLYTRSRCP